MSVNTKYYLQNSFATSTKLSFNSLNAESQQHEHTEKLYSHRKVLALLKKNPLSGGDANITLQR
jgi:hypothetical protein